MWFWTFDVTIGKNEVITVHFLILKKITTKKPHQIKVGPLSKKNIGKTKKEMNKHFRLQAMVGK